jgi:hypothetical protein
MIKINTDGPVGERCRKWRERARHERDLMIGKWKESGKTPEPKQVIWKALKVFFLNDVFHQKCAYCEGKVSGHFPLHVEHYRPKKAVTEDRAAIDHKGYFWLAYEWYNLLLACQDCNSGHTSYKKGKDSSHPGKANEFRVLGNRIVDPPDNPEEWPSILKGEQPLLLNPYFDDPSDHISFDDEGVPYPKNNSPYGRETIKVCHLDRFELVEARHDMAEYRVKTQIINRLGELEKGERSVDDPYFKSSDPYSAWLNHKANVITKGLRKPFDDTDDHMSVSDENACQV